jgi:asparagine synthase (glutamine-hydrolysing)
MLSMRIAPEQPGQPWVWTGARWRCGSSRVVPYRHLATEQLAVADGTRTVLVTRERCSDRPPASPAVVHTTSGTVDTLLMTLDRWPGDWTAVETRGRGPVRVLAGARGIAPVYLTVGSGVLYGSWDLAELRGRFDGQALDIEEAARRVAMVARYCTATPWRDVRLLTERARAEYAAGKLVVRYPAPSPHSHARELRPGADVVGAFGRVLDQAVADRMWTPDANGVQLSGGMDSANVALSLARAEADGAVTSTAVLLPGEAGRQQARRRRLLLSAFGAWQDTTVEAEEYLPLHPASARMRGCPLPPNADLYLEALEASTRRLTDAGVATVSPGSAETNWCSPPGTRSRGRRATAWSPTRGWARSPTRWRTTPATRESRRPPWHLKAPCRRRR